MLKISIVDNAKHRRLVLEGLLVAPWARELETSYEMARTGLDGRELVVHLKNVIAISNKGEDILLELMNDGVKLRCEGMFTKHILRQIARKSRRLQETRNDF